MKLVSQLKLVEFEVVLIECKTIQARYWDMR